MLNALLHSKLSFTDEAQSRLRAGDEGVLARREDPLTATVFERLSYLPEATMLDLLSAAVEPLRGSRELPRPGGEARWRFWPRFKPAGVSSGSWVEPDVAVVWDRWVFLFEAKHRGVQAVGQWRAQVLAARQDPRLGWQEKKIVLIAAGGLRPDLDGARAQSGEDLACPVFRLRWRALRTSATKLAHQSEGPSRRLVDDIVRALDFWGYGPAPKVGSLGPVGLSRSFDASLGTLKNWNRND